MADEKGIEQVDEATEKEETQERVPLAWFLVAMAEHADFDQMADMLEPIMNDVTPTCAQYGAFMSRLEREHPLDKKKSTTKLPHLAENYWDVETETLLCYDAKERVAQLWRKDEAR